MSVKIIQKYMTKNRCYYSDGRYIDPIGVMWHSDGCKAGIKAKEWYDRWNNSSIDACVNFWVDDTEIYQYLPCEKDRVMRPWGCYMGWNGSGNNLYIQFEIAEPTDYSDKAYFEKVYKNAIWLTVYLLKQQGITEVNETTLTNHQEAYKNGLASNHADTDHWFGKYFGKYMDDIRADVAKALKDDDFDIVIEDKDWLEKGDEGDAVKTMQKNINKVIRGTSGFNLLDEDGSFGSATDATVRDLQEALGLEVDGSYGPTTKATIERLAGVGYRFITIDDADWFGYALPKYPETTNGDPTPEPDPEPTPEPDKPEITTLYRVRKSFGDAKSSLGSFAKLENAIKVWKEGYFIYDMDGNVVYPKETLTPAPEEKILYRVRKTWTGEDNWKADGQVGAYYSLDTAKKVADEHGLNVYNPSGKLVYAPQKAFEPYVIKVPSSLLNVRTEPSTKSGKVIKQVSNIKLTIVGEYDGEGAAKWGKLKSKQEYNGALVDGYIALDYCLDENAVEPYVVGVDSELNVRTGAGTNYPVIKTISNIQLTIVEESDGQGADKWGKLKSKQDYNGELVDGWIALDYTYDPSTRVEGVLSYNTDGSVKCTRYLQGDSRWASHPYNGTNLAGQGCGPSSVAIIASAYGLPIAPPDVADIMMSIGGAEPAHVGRVANAIKTVVGKRADVYLNFDIIANALAAGHICMIFVQEDADKRYMSYSGMHFLVANGLSGDYVCVTNPINGKDNGWVPLTHLKSGFNHGWVVEK